MKKRYLVIWVFLALFIGLETSLHAQLIPSELRKEDKFKSTRPASSQAIKPPKDKNPSSTQPPTASTPGENQPTASASKGDKKGKKPPKGEKTKKTNKKNVVESPQNVIRLNLTSLVLSNLDLGFERAIGNKFTVGLSGSYLLTSVFSPTSLDGLGGDGATTVKFDLSNLSGFRATPSFRYYPGGKRNAPHGFYLELFGRYYRYDLKLPYESVDILNPTEPERTASGNISLSGFGGGLSLGAQWIIANRITLDWNILGLGTAISSIDGQFKGDETLTQEDYNDIARDVESFYTDIPTFPSSNITTTAKADGVDITATGLLMPLVRSNITIGFAF